MVGEQWGLQGGEQSVAMWLDALAWPGMVAVAGLMINDLPHPSCRHRGFLLFNLPAAVQEMANIYSTALRQIVYLGHALEENREQAISYSLFATRQ